jgi:hypothetical protein
VNNRLCAGLVWKREPEGWKRSLKAKIDEWWKLLSAFRLLYKPVDAQILAVFPFVFSFLVSWKAINEAFQQKRKEIEKGKRNVEPKVNLVPCRLSILLLRLTLGVRCLSSLFLSPLFPLLIVIGFLLSLLEIQYN